MSGRGAGGGRGSGDGYYGRGDDGPPSTIAASGSSTAGGGSSGNLPVWALVLIMVGSGLITLTFLWLCVLFICRKRRARRAAVRDLESAQTSFQSERETARMLGRAGIDPGKEEDAKRCEAEAGVELTFVVMAGEDQPSYLAKPAPQKPMKGSAGGGGGDVAKSPPEAANLQLEKQTQQHGNPPASETPIGGVGADVVGTDSDEAHQPVVVVDQKPPKTPPSPS